MKPTPAQRQAIEAQDRSIVVQAGAGTGKTWVLVRRFMHLLETNPDWPLESIIAITFTEKAAREMRGRIRQAVETKAKQQPDDPVWQARRRGLNCLQVSTIHSLCARILRENAVAAVIDPRFQVLDEQEADLLKEEAIRETIQQLDENDHPALELLASLQVRDLSEIMASLLSQRGTLQRLFDNLESLEQLLQRWQDGLETMRASIWERCLQEDPNLSLALESLPYVAIQDPEDKLAGSVVLGQKGCQQLKQGNLVEAAQTWLEINLRGGRQANWGGKETLKALKDDLRAVRAAAKELKKKDALQTIGPDDQLAAKHLHLWRSLWDQLNAIYDQIKEERQALDFDDLELLTAQLLSKTPRPQRLQRFLGDIRQLMVDEFQDTNLIQQQIIYDLAPPESGHLFLVGDAKQSIYRFRQAQVSVFNQSVEDMKKITGHDAVSLSTSFRSHQSVVIALNHLFEIILKPIGETHAPYEASPAPLQADRDSHPTLAAPVELVLIPKQDRNEESINAEDGRIWEARWLARHLIRLQEEEMLVWDKDQKTYRPFEFGDAAILFRATTNLPLYEAAFKDAVLPYLTVSGRGYYDRPEVRDLIALLRALHNPDDDLSLASALRSPLFNLNDETLYQLRWHTPSGALSEEPIAYRQALKDPPATGQADQVAFAAQVLEALWQLKGRIDVWNLLRTALDKTGYEATLTLNDGETGRQQANVEKFLALARDIGGASLSHFLRRLHDLQIREAREGEALGREPESGAVQLMSIHAAKGLEFPVVVVADLGRKKQSGFHSPYLLHDPEFGLVCKQRDQNGDWQKAAGYAWGEWLYGSMEEAENKRLLYVACTRAADKLILSGQVGRSNSWMAEILAAWEIADQGDQTQRVSYDGYEIEVHRPVEQPDLNSSAPVATRSHPGLTEIHPLAQPYPSIPQAPSIAVTKLDQLLQDGGQPRELIPALWAEEKQTSLNRAPGYMIGNIVHRALADLDCLSAPEQKLFQQLEKYAGREGVFPSALPHAVKTARWMLGHVQNHPLFEQINGAKTRHHEISFTLSSPVGMLHGVIDLLYQDQNDDWHVIDWKTEWAPEEAVEESSEEHLTQMAAYAQAVGAELGIEPNVALCYLNPKMVLFPFSHEFLVNTWKEKVLQTGNQHDCNHPQHR